MTNKVIHVSEEIHEKISEYCRNNGLFMTEWLEYLILKEIIGEAKTPVKRKKLKKLDNTVTNFMNGQGNWSVPPSAGVSAAQYLIDHVVGSANKKYATCIKEGNAAPGAAETLFEYRNVGSGASYVVFGMPVPLHKIVNGTSYDLHIDRLKIGIDLVDINNYVTNVYLASWTTFGAYTIHYTSTTDLNTANDWVIVSLVDLAASERTFIVLQTQCTITQSLKVSYVKINYYYDN